MRENEFSHTVKIVTKLTLLLALIVSVHFAQLPTIGVWFDNSGECLGEVIQPTTNSTSPVVRHHWDYCHQMANGETTSTLVGVVSGTPRYFGGDSYYDPVEQRWYVFMAELALNRINRTILSADGNTVISSTDITITSLVPTATGTGDCRAVKDKITGQCYLFVSSQGAARLVRFNYGTSFANVPTTTTIGDVGGAISGSIRAIDLVEDNGSYYMITCPITGNDIDIFHFNLGLANIPARINGFSSVSGESFFNLVKQNNVWYALGMVRGSANYSIVTIGDIFTGTPSSPVNVSSGGLFSDANRCRYLKEGPNQYLFVTNRTSGNIVRINLTSDLTKTAQHIRTNLGNAGVATEKINIAVGYKEFEPHLFFVSTGGATRELRHITFATTECQDSNDTSTVALPQFLFTTVGPRNILYRAYSNAYAYRDTMFTVNVLPLPNFTINSSASICSNSASDYSYEFLTASTALSQAWDFGDGNGTSVSPSVSYAYTQSGTYNIRLDVVANNGCSNTVTKMITVSPAPLVDFAVGTICPGDSVVFTNNSSINSGSISVSRWDFGNGQTVVSSSSSFKYKYLTPDTYTVKLKCFSAVGCVDSVSKQVIVPGATITAQNKCIGGSGTLFTCNYIPPAGANLTTMTWTINGEVLSGNNLTYIFGFPGTYPIKVNLQYDNGCKDSVLTNIVIGDIPQVAFSAGQVCRGSVTTFVDASTIAVGEIASWAWDFNDNNDPGNSTSTIENPTHVYSVAGDYMVSLTVTSTSGCSAMLSKQITIFEPEELDILSNDNVCNNELLQLQTTTPFTSYLWTLPTEGGSLFSTLPSPNFFVSNLGVNTISLVVINSHGCQLNTSKSFTVYNAPQADFSYSMSVDNKVYRDSTITLQSLNTGLQTYQWKILPTGDILTGASTSYVFLTSGQFTIRHIVTTSEGCVDSTDRVVTVFVAPPPVLDLALVQAVCDNNNNKLTTSFSIKNTGSKTVSRFEVQLTNGLRQSSFETFYVTIAPGETLDTLLSYSVFVPDNDRFSYNCIEIISVNNEQDTIIENNKSCCLLQNNFKVNAVYPNPVVDNLVLDISTAERQSISISIYNTDGQLVKRWQGLTVSKSQQNLQLDVSGIPGGLYLLIAQQGNAMSEHKFLITGVSQN